MADVAYEVNGGKSVTHYHSLLYLDTNRILPVIEGPDHFGIEAIEPEAWLPCATAMDSPTVIDVHQAAEQLSECRSIFAEPMGKFAI
jgi:hypothetical protein